MTRTGLAIAFLWAYSLATAAPEWSDHSARERRLAAILGADVVGYSRPRSTLQRRARQPRGADDGINLT